MKINKLGFIIIPLILSFCSACTSKDSSIISAEPINFYIDNDYLITDPNKDKTNILVLIYSRFCSHCVAAEPYLKEAKEKYFPDLTFVAISSYDLANYSLPKTYTESVEFYYAQDSDYIDPYFLPDGLYNYSSFPTPTALYLGENRELVHILFGLDDSLNGIKEDIELLIKTEEKAG